MADYQFNTNLTPNIQGTNIADMVNLARGVQAYQQAEQANPLAIQRAQMEIEQAKKMNPLAVSKATEEVKQAETGTKKGQFELNSIQTQKLYDLAGGILNDPRIKSGNKADAINVLTEARKRAHTYGIPEETVEGVFAPIMNQAVTNPASVPAVLNNIIQSGLGATGQQTLQTPSLVTTPGGPATFKTGQNTLMPAQIGGQQPPPPQGQPQGQPQQPPQGVTSTQMSLQYPVRKAGDIRPFAPNEAVDTEKGVAYRNALTTRQTDLAASRRNLDEVIKQSEKIAKESTKFMGLDTATGTLGSLSRTYAGIVGDPTYKQLSKDLANVQISNLQTMGGDMSTDAGKHLVRMANGDETYPPDVLIGIARRTYADLTNLDMQATAASKFAQKYGDSNLNSFKRMWSNNADSKVFEAMSIFENVKDPARAKEDIDKLLGPNPQVRQQFFNKYNNIKKLTATGEL
jgi:hypothetical protein